MSIREVTGDNRECAVDGKVRRAMIEKQETTRKQMLYNNGVTVIFFNTKGSLCEEYSQSTRTARYSLQGT
jgi:hypothetical protein